MEKPWCELVHSFAGTTAEGYKSHTDYGFKPGHETDTESDSESAKGETFSSVTHYDAPHEDELDELYSLQENKGRGRQCETICVIYRYIDFQHFIEYYASSPVDETPLDALQQSHRSTTTETKQETGRFHMYWYVCQHDIKKKAYASSVLPIKFCHNMIRSLVISAYIQSFNIAAVDPNNYMAQSKYPHLSLCLLPIQASSVQMFKILKL